MVDHGPKIIKPIAPAVVEALAARGHTTEGIAGILGVSRSTLYRRIAIDPEVAAALEKGRATIADEILGLQVKVAREGSVPMLIHLGKQWCGQVDKQETTHRGEGGIRILYPDNGRERPEVDAEALDGPEVAGALEPAEDGEGDP